MGTGLFFNEQAHEGTFGCVHWVVMESFDLMVSFRLASRVFRRFLQHSYWSMLHSMKVNATQWKCHRALKQPCMHVCVVSIMGDFPRFPLLERGDQVKVDEIVRLLKWRSWSFSEASQVFLVGVCSYKINQIIAEIQRMLFYFNIDEERR